MLNPFVEPRIYGCNRNFQSVSKSKLFAFCLKKHNKMCLGPVLCDGFAKSFDPCQPAQSAQANMGQNLSLPLYFLYVKGPFYTMIWPVV